MRRSSVKEPVSESTEDPAVLAEDVQSVDRIRDIIFGAQMRDYEVRFRELEQRLLKEADTLRKQVEDQRQILEQLVEKKNANLSKKLTDETSQRKDSVRELEKILRQTETELNKKLRAQVGGADQAISELRKDLIGRIEDFTKAVKKEVSRLQLEKTDRQSLAGLLREAADAIGAPPEE